MRTSVPPHSPLESVIYDVIERSHLPMPRLQLTIRDSHGAFIARPDFVYLDEKLVVQGHSKKWHWGEAAESKDLDQHNRLGALGFRIIYVTWADATRYPDHLVATIDAHLRVAA
jgi:very-short-patch-repair endonuclease